MAARIRAVLAVLAVALGMAGCGLGSGPATGGASLTVTHGFGAHRVGAVTSASLPGSETVMRMLERSYRITTSYGGGFVDSIAGLGSNGPRVNWFYYVNGVQAPKGAAATPVHAGDRIWWDLHDWSATDSIPAVVGSYPEPFVHGISGKRYPVTVECAPDVQSACRRVTAALAAAHVPTGPQLLGTGSGPDTLGIVVGTWSEIRSEVAAELLAYGPSASGVYARFTAGDRLALLAPSGRVARTLGAGAGLIAATADNTSVPTWMVTGTDVAGVTAAASALNPSSLRDRFALALDSGAQIPVPVPGSP